MWPARNQIVFKKQTALQNISKAKFKKIVMIQKNKSEDNKMQLRNKK